MVKAGLRRDDVQVTVAWRRGVSGFSSSANFDLTKYWFFRFLTNQKRLKFRFFIFCVEHR
jgi:hypothetical protein